MLSAVSRAVTRPPRRREKSFSKRIGAPDFSSRSSIPQ